MITNLAPRAMLMLALVIGYFSGVGQAIAATVTYDVSGTFQKLTGSDYSALSGGSFSGTFTVPKGTFPLPSNTYDIFYSFTLNIYTSTGALFSILSSTTPGANLVITNDYESYYGGGEPI